MTPDIAIIHDNDSCRVQGSDFNAGQQDLPAFLDRLVVFSVPKGCPGSDDTEHEVMFDSDVDGDPVDNTEPDLAARSAGPLMAPTVGPFPAGSQRLMVNLANDLGLGDAIFNRIEVRPAAEPPRGG